MIWACREVNENMLKCLANQYASPNIVVHINISIIFKSLLFSPLFFSLFKLSLLYFLLLLLRLKYVVVLIHCLNSLKSADFEREKAIFLTKRKAHLEKILETKNQEQRH